MFRGGLPSDFDHLLVAVPVLEQGMEALARRLGVRPEPGGRHAQWGSRNALLALGPGRYLELLAPDPDANEAARREGDRVFGFSRSAEPRVIGWCAAATDLPGRRASANDAGVDLGEPVTGGRERPDGSMVRWSITPPLFLGDGLIPFFIDWGRTPHPSLEAPSGCRLLRLEGEHPDPERIWKMLAAVGSQLSVSRGPRARLIATFEGPAGSLTLADGGGAVAAARAGPSAG